MSELLIRRGADVNAVSVGGHTPLSVTDTYGMEAEARLLESHGARRPSDGAAPRAGPWMGEEPPGPEPKVFAPDLVSSNRFEHGTVTFSLRYPRDPIGRYELTVWLVDEGGRASNRLSGTIYSRT